MTLSFCRGTDTVIDVNVCTKLEQLLELWGHYLNIYFDTPSCQLTLDTPFQNGKFVGRILLAFSSVKGRNNCF